MALNFLDVVHAQHSSFLGCKTFFIEQNLAATTIGMWELVYLQQSLEGATQIVEQL